MQRHSASVHKHMHIHTPRSFSIRKVSQCIALGYKELCLLASTSLCMIHASYLHELSSLSRTQFCPTCNVIFKASLNLPVNEYSLFLATYSNRVMPFWKQYSKIPLICNCGVCLNKHKLGYDRRQNKRSFEDVRYLFILRNRASLAKLIPF